MESTFKINLGGLKGGSKFQQPSLTLKVHDSQSKGAHELLRMHKSATRAVDMDEKLVPGERMESQNHEPVS
ncbi:hypothetical protein V6N13_039959 [Hibiscus sabdariffa]